MGRGEEEWGRGGEHSRITFDESSSLFPLPQPLGKTLQLQDQLGGRPVLHQRQEEVRHNEAVVGVLSQLTNQEQAEGR